eukprot:1178877-Prorocentrum_minimum.AAC.2
MDQPCAGNEGIFSRRTNRTPPALAPARGRQEVKENGGSPNKDAANSRPNSALIRMQATPTINKQLRAGQGPETVAGLGRSVGASRECGVRGGGGAQVPLGPEHDWRRRHRSHSDGTVVPNRPSIVDDVPERLLEYNVAQLVFPKLESWQED